MSPESYLLAAVTALAAVVTVLWRTGVSAHAAQLADLKAEISRLHESEKDLVSRLRSLEDSRASVAIDVTQALNDNTQAMREMTRAMNSHRCLATFNPQPFTDKDTDVIVRRDMGHA